MSLHKSVFRLCAGALFTLVLFNCATAAAAPVPVMKRSTLADWRGYDIAHNAWVNGDDDPAQRWLTGRYDTLVTDVGPDWRTSWAPRNWHANAWAYRKSTSYLRALGLHTAPATERFFVKGTIDPTKPIGDPGRTATAAIQFDCGTGGCSQALLDLTNADARAFWLYGEDWASKGVVDPATGDCHQKWESTYGVLDLLACKNGPLGSGNGNIKGLWLDDVLGDLQTSSRPADAAANSHVAWLDSGAAISNGELWQALPFTAAAWTDGMTKLLTDLRQGIAALRSRGVLTATQGKVAINYKWHSFGYGTRAPSGPAPGLNIDPIGAKLIQAADYVELENGWIDGVRPGAGASQGLVAGGVETPWSFSRRRLFVKQVHDLGRNVIEEKTNSADMLEYNDAPCLGDYDTQDAARNLAHSATAQYNLAATLLNWVPGDMVGDICELYQRGWDGYASDLGTPLPGDVITHPGTGILERRFTQGRVLVAPPGASGTVGLDHPMYARTDSPDAIGQPLTETTSVTLAPREGRVLLEKACSETSCPPALATRVYDLNGTMKLPTIARSDVPLKGTLTTTRSGTTVKAAFAFNDVKVRAVSSGIQPVVVTLGVVPSGTPNLMGFTPVFQGTPGRFRIKLKDARYFGAIPVDLGNNCQTKSLSTLPWTGDVRPAGGTIASRFAISDLNGCLAFNGGISPLTASSQNSLSLTVTPR